MKKPRPASIEQFNKLVELYRFTEAEIKNHKVGTDLWLQLTRTKSLLYADIVTLAGLSMTRFDRIIKGETTWQQLYEEGYK